MHPVTIEPLRLYSAAVMTTAEFAIWAQVGKNAVPGLAARFGIRELTGRAKGHRYSVHEILRKIIGVTPRNTDDLEALLQPLQKTTWVSGTVGLSVSALNAAICEKRLLLPAPIELTRTDHAQAAARCKRWIPAQIVAYLRGDPIPFLPDAGKPPASGSPADPTFGNVFAAICADNAGISRQCQL